MALFTNSRRQDKQLAEDLDFITDASAGQLMRSPNSSHILLWSVLALILVLLLWASLSTINEIVRGQGKAIPISHTQVIQSLEGGLVKSILVREGQAVNQNELLMELDETEASTGLVTSVAETSALLAEEIRLAAEVNENKPDFTEERKVHHDKYVDTQLQLYNIRQQDLVKTVNDLRLKVKKANQDLVSAEQQKKDLLHQLGLIQQQINMNKPLLDMGAISETAMIDIQQNYSRVKTEENKVANMIPGLEAEIERLEEQTKEVLISFKAKAQQQLAEVRTKLDIAQGKQTLKQTSVERTQLRSPVNGVVQKLYINTIGGVAKPGMPIIDVIPVGDEILVEAKVKPKDVGFLRVGQPAMVKITAFDFAVYGGLEGVVETVSADTITDPKGNSFYLIKVRVEKAWFDDGDQRLLVIPGMMATVDVSVAERSVLEFILKPLLRVLR
ncbi:Type I secretion system membrane fusion protein PrsE [Sinobacterium norvegicum]|uniref:Membrane fusion protein (MFP) family protein n=1 Tax=Sinobacterium norvegicum TaxID=1641715 RepID=A0ABM9AAP5_9GAMM|nr:HlyD family type I secretion periplasmic adaptor subunit [Sinobacterium norvegicum]CAH0990023.1 Type I secretion system membrane fusion protein PrsE [Sinobacterium norvegicum]